MAHRAEVAISLGAESPTTSDVQVPPTREGMSAAPADDPPIAVALAPPANQPPLETAPPTEPTSADGNESPGGSSAEEEPSAVTHDGVVWPGAGATPSSCDHMLPFLLCKA